MIAKPAHTSTRRMLLASALALAGCSSRLPPYGRADAPLVSHPAADERFTLPDGTVLPARVWLPTDGQPPRTVVLALHGFNDSRDQWEIPAPDFARAGIAVFAPDQRGFGDTAARGTWPGVATLVGDADAMARGLRQRFPGARLFVMGESMGGAIVIDLAAAATPPPVDGYIMLSPAVWGRPEQGFVLSSALAVANGVAPGYHITGGEVPVTIHATDNHAALLALRSDPLTIRSTQVSVLNGLVNLMDSAQDAAPHISGPAFVAYGEHDDLVPPDAMATAWAKLPPGTRRAIYPGGYHLLMRDLGRDAVIGDVMAWMSAPDALLPSGADIAAASWTTTHHPGGGLEF